MKDSVILRTRGRGQGLWCTKHARFLPGDAAECVICRVEAYDQRMAIRTAVAEKRETAVSRA